MTQLEDGKIMISFLRGAQLLCRRPVVRIRVSCSHPVWWRRLLGAPEYCGEIPPMTFGMLPREAYVLDETACDHARLSVDRQPSYHDKEARDRRLYPYATPCGCKP